MSWGPSLAWTQKPHQRRPLGPPRKGIGETRPSGCARKRSSRRSFPLDTADFVRDVLRDRAGPVLSLLAGKPTGTFRRVLVRNADGKVSGYAFSAKVEPANVNALTRNF